MIEALVVLTTALFSTENATFLKAVDVNRNDGYRWEYVGKQKPVNKEYSITMDDHIYFKHVKDD
jgi:hypothetical protein